MKLNLLDAVGNIGVITECKPLVRDKIEIDVGCEGVLCLSTTDSISCMTKQKAYKTNSGKVVINDYDMPQGTSRIEFSKHDGKKYDFGQIQRNGRFIQVVNSLDKLTVALALAYNEQGDKLKELEAEIKTIKKQYGISIM